MSHPGLHHTIGQIKDKENGGVRGLFVVALRVVDKAFDGWLHCFYNKVADVGHPDRMVVREQV